MIPSMEKNVNAAPAASRPPVLTMDGVVKKYGDYVALDKVDFSLSDNEVVAIIGPSGSGKSTLLRCINMLELIDAGRIHFKGESIGVDEIGGVPYRKRRRDMDRERRHFGMVFQAFNLFPHYTALENVLAGPRLVLDGDASGPVRNLAVMSEVAPSYAPPGRASVVAAVPGPDALAGDLPVTVRRQLRGWFGAEVDGWDLLRVDVIPHGQPDQRPPLHPRQRVSLGDGLFVCGDHRDTASIQGALFSGRRTGAAVLAGL